MRAERWKGTEAGQLRMGRKEGRTKAGTEKIGSREGDERGTVGGGKV